MGISFIFSFAFCFSSFLSYFHKKRVPAKHCELLRLYGRSGGMQWCQTTEQGASITSLWIFLPLLLNPSSSWSPPNPRMTLSHSNWFCRFQASWVLSVALQSSVGTGPFLHLRPFRLQRVLILLQSHWGNHISNNRCSSLRSETPWKMPRT